MINKNSFENHISNGESDLVKAVEFQELVKIKQKRYKRKKSNFKKEYRRKYF